MSYLCTLWVIYLLGLFMTFHFSIKMKHWKLETCFIYFKKKANYFSSLEYLLFPRHFLSIVYKYTHATRAYTHTYTLHTQKVSSRFSFQITLICSYLWIVGFVSCMYLQNLEILVPVCSLFLITFHHKYNLQATLS